MKNQLSKVCDLHIHSAFSDSDTSIEEIFEIAQGKGLHCIAITDHDTVGGMAEARTISKAYNLENIAAIELSAQRGDREVHILGYFIDSTNKKLNDALSNMRERRRNRLMSMVDKLNNLGVKVDKEEILLRIKDAIPTRLHLALYLVEKRKVKSFWDAFKKYLEPGKLAYVSRFKYSVKETIQLIKDAGGLAFLAHPHFLSQTPWIEEFVSFGLDGLEVAYPRYSQAKISLYEAIADKYNLLKSGGSDAHGSYKEFTKIGGVTVPYQWVEEMKNRLVEVKS